jgi:hypothetical protein
MKNTSWIEYAIGLGIPPFDAADIVLDVSQSLTEQTLPIAFELFAAACADYLQRSGR